MPAELTSVVHVEHVMGTTVSFDVRTTPDDVDHARRVIAAAVHILHTADAVFSTYRPDSDISRLNRGELRLAACHPDVARVLDLCAWFEAKTDGYFTARYDGSIDPTGLVKGWAVDRAAQHIADAGYQHVLVNGGGDIAAVGGRAPGLPWRVGIAHPFRSDVLLATVELFTGGVATSGTTCRGAHVINPRTGSPATEWASITVSGPDLVSADVYATAALARGRSALTWLSELPGYRYWAVSADGAAWQSPSLSAVR